MQGWVYLCSLAPGPSEILRRTNLIRNGRRGATDAPRTSRDAASLSQCLIKDFPHFTELISQLLLHLHSKCHELQTLYCLVVCWQYEHQ